MKIQYCSDLHLEFDRNSNYLSAFPLSVSGEVLILAGDIVPLHDEFIRHDFFDVVSKNYKHVFWIPGNHEFYYKDLMQFPVPLNIQIRENIFLVNNTVFELDDVRFVFSCLWSHIGRENSRIIEQHISDFRQILINDRKIRYTDFNQLHDDSVTFLANELGKPHLKTVVVTHHLPSALCNAPEHAKSPVNEAFCTNMTDFIAAHQARFWIYGHSHYNCAPVYINKTVLLTNQLGYVHLDEAKGFRKNAFFVI